MTPDNRVSRRHARLTYEDGVYWIKDLGSKRGTWVDGQKITEKTRLTPWPKVQVGQAVIEIIGKSADGSRTAHPRTEPRAGDRR